MNVMVPLQPVLSQVQLQEVMAHHVILVVIVQLEAAVYRDLQVLRSLVYVERVSYHGL